ncbi:hypothetical protein SAMN06893096_103246 [Geodermatophilus pulveris]|uniref:Uncharacterized protein n=1 Tax=Geodermatophilus pulveris TaxID=1564159 RepID=A0A239DKK5_9ACTN|nr:hypothetical protein SAMN06893096_103246 [Geodermatophilus pulveris]
MSLYLRAARTVPLAQPFKVLTADSAAVEVLDPEPDMVERGLGPVVRWFEAAADALGHIQYAGPERRFQAPSTGRDRPVTPMSRY